MTHRRLAAGDEPLHPRILALLCPFLCLVPSHSHPNNENFFKLNDRDLVALAREHSVHVEGCSMADLRLSVLQHVFTGSCAQPGSPAGRPGCRYLVELVSGHELAIQLLHAVMSATVRQLPSCALGLICKALGSELTGVEGRYFRRSAHSALRSYVSSLEQGLAYRSQDTSLLLHQLDNRRAADLNDLASHHALRYVSADTMNVVRDKIAEHVVTGSCHTGATTASSSHAAPACVDVASQFESSTGSPCRDTTEMQIYVLGSIVDRASLSTLRRVLTLQSVEFESLDSVSKLRRRLRRHIKYLRKGKFLPGQSTHAEKPAPSHTNHAGVSLPDDASWLQLVSAEDKLRMLRAFRDDTGKAALQEFVCGSCHARYRMTQRRRVAMTDVLLEMFAVQKDRPSVFASYTTATGLATLLHPSAVLSDCDGPLEIAACCECRTQLLKDKMPALAVANNLALGPIPDELKELTIVEEAMIARCRAKAWIVQLKEEPEEEGLPGSHRPWAQHAMRGHIICYPQQVSHISSLLPPSLEEISARIAVIFVGSSPPSADWLREKAKPLSVRADRVRAALVWLKQHNPLYKDITINDSVLSELEAAPIPFSVHHVEQNGAQETLTSRYDPQSRSGDERDGSVATDVAFENVVIADVEGRVSSSDMRASALRHIMNGGGSLHIYHDPKPADTFGNPALFPMMYPTLFPYGLGGFESAGRRTKLSLKRQVKHFLNLHDRRFQEHPTFLFTAFSLVQRRSILLQAKLKTQRASFQAVAEDIAATSWEAVQRVAERAAAGECVTATDDEERRVLNLMREVKVLSSKVPGSAAAKINMRNEIRALMMTKGMPSWYITVNPADVYNPIVQFLAGADIDVDNLLPEQVPQFFEQARLIAKNPVVAAKFFNIYMHAFIKTLLGYNPKSGQPGLLGRVSAFYGCVEAQGRGTLHCHMLIWIDGALNPNEIKERVLADMGGDFQRRLLAMLDDIIANCVPPDPGNTDGQVPSDRHHACSVRGPDFSLPAESLEAARQRDLRNTVLRSQMHNHSATCYKYCKDSEPRQCRFDLDEANYWPESTVDPESGELNLRCLDGLVNNYNATMLEALRCNMDIKFIGSGPAAKAILYYVTDYITKSPLKSHVSYAALETAVKRLDEFGTDASTSAERAKHMLQKCAYAMISHQELSSQQVASYLTDEEDHFTSHEFTNLYWRSFERHIQKQSPSPECGPDQTEHVLQPEQIQHEDVPEPDSDSENEVEKDFESSEVQQDGDSDEESEEVVISVEDGRIVPRGGQLADYIFRGPALHDMCLWDTTCYVDKVPQKSLQRRQRRCAENETESNSDSSDDSDENCSSDEDSINSRIPAADDFDLYSELHNQRRRRPISALRDPHPEKDSHVLRLRSLRVPVPIGPAIPRRDRPECYARYCRLMLILFKPWRQAEDLRLPGQTWEEAFLQFNSQCRAEHRKIMENMQVLHECKDSRDDHFKNGRPRRNRAARVSTEMSQGRASRDNFEFSGDYQAAIAEHIESVSYLHHDAKLQEQKTASECLLYATEAGLFDLQGMPHNPETHMHKVTDIGPGPHGLEIRWRKEYDKRRARTKKAAQCHVPARQAPQNDPPSERQARMSFPVPEQAEAGRTQDSIASHIVMGNVQGPHVYPSVGLEDLVQKFTLNHEQATAFRIVAERSLTSGGSPLRMMLSGPGGTGKSRVIHALKDWFDQRNQSRRFRLTSYTGVAANNISGMTLHSALALSRKKSSGSDLMSRRDLAAMWDGVDFLFVDEVSMIGCNLMADISEALCDAKGTSASFGGINIIFAGDFCQLPPVRQPRLFKRLDTRSIRQGGSAYGQKSIQGKLLWLLVQTVVVLEQPMRQSGAENARFVALLERLREGRCTDEDYSMLRTRELSTLSRSLQGPTWNDLRRSPMIVSENAVKDALNIRATEFFAAETGQQVHWYYSQDTYRGHEITDQRILSALDLMHSGATSPQMMRKLPLVPGMPVVITQNYDVEGGIVNGSRGTLRSIRYETDGSGRRRAKSCIVEVPSSTGTRLCELSEHNFPVLEESAELKIIHKMSGRSCSLQRKQLAILPGFAMTTHKAQGETMSSAIVDLQGCKGSEAPYVMASRVRSLEGLLILRPFDLAKIRCRNSEELRREQSRLRSLADRRNLASHDGTLMAAADETDPRSANERLADFQDRAMECVPSSRTTILHVRPPRRSALKRRTPETQDVVTQKPARKRQRHTHKTTSS